MLRRNNQFKMKFEFSKIVGGKTLHVTQGSSDACQGSLALLVLHCYPDSMTVCHTGLVCMHAKVVLHWRSNEVMMQQRTFK